MLQKKDKEKILFFRESVFKAVEVIFNYPNRTFHIRELAKITGLSTTAIMSNFFLRDLRDYGIIKVEKTDLTTNIRANLDSDSYRFYKKIFNLYKLERYGIVENLKETFNASSIVLFGSFSKGEDIEESDVDLLVITNQKEKQNVERFIEVWEKELSRKIDIHVLPSLDKSAKEFKNAVANGIVLHGYLKVV